MIKNTTLTLLLLLLSVRLFAVSVVGTFRNPDNTPFNGTLELTLQVAAAVAITPTYVVTQGPVRFKITNGVLQYGASLLANDTEINPPDTTYYRAYEKDTSGAIRQMANIVVTSPGPFDIGHAIVTNITTPNLSYQDIIGLRNFSNTGWAHIHNLTCTGTVTDCVNGTGGIVRYEDLATGQFPDIDLRYYDAVGDALQFNTCSMANGSHTLTCNDSLGRTFQSSDVGKLIGVSQADVITGLWQSMLITTISAFTSGTQVTLVDAANANTGGGTYAIFGTDNCTMFGTATHSTDTSYTGKYANGILTGRGVSIPGGHYVSSCPLYVHVGMFLFGAGEAASQLTLLSHTNPVNTATPNWNTVNINPAVCVGGNASAGPNTCTRDSLPATGATGLSNVLGATPGNNAPDFFVPNASGVVLDHFWTEGNFGAVVYNGQAIQISGQTCDIGAPYCLVLAGKGNPANTFDARVSGMDCFNAGTCIWIDGMGEVDIVDSSLRYAINNGILISSPVGNYTSYRVHVGSGTKFIGNPAQGGSNGLHINGGCVDCSVVGAQFSNQANYDIDFDNSSNTPDFLIANNTHSNGANLSGVAAIQTQAGATGNLIIEGDVFDGPGQYALFDILQTKLIGNHCTDPFSRFAPLSGVLHQSGCFYLTGTAAHSVEVKDNSTTNSGTPCQGATTACPSVAVNAASNNIAIVSEGNTSDFNGCALCVSNNASLTSVAWLERSANAAASGDGLFIAKFDPVAGLMKLPNMTLSLAAIAATGNVTVGGTLGVAGAASLNGGVAVTGPISGSQGSDGVPACWKTAVAGQRELGYCTIVAGACTACN